MGKTYEKALRRLDLSEWVVHLTKPTSAPSMSVLLSILGEGRVRASQREEITKYDPVGAACFYDVPRKAWPDLIETNPSRRKGYGILVYKPSFWRAGGRPAIYDSNPGDPRWPEHQRFRLIWTDLTREPDPVDWTHEREWRIRGDLSLNALNGGWVPCVERDSDVAEILADFPSVPMVYSIQAATVFQRTSS